MSSWWFGTLCGGLLVLAALAHPQELEPLRSTAPPVISLNVLPPSAQLAPVPGEAAPPSAPAAESPASTPAPTAAVEALQQLYDTGAAEGDSPVTLTEESIWLSAIRTFFWLCVLCALIILGGYVLRRFPRKSPLLAGQRLGTVLGKMYLEPKTAIHFVKVADRVLLIGVSGQQVALLTEFEAAAFEEAMRAPGEVAGDGLQLAPGNSPAGFLAELQAQSRQMQAPDDDLLHLRGDIERLQASLQEKLRDHR